MAEVKAGDEMTILTVKLTRAELKRLRDLSRRMGYKIGRGPMAKEGSPRQLIRALARGHLGITAADVQDHAMRRIDP